MDEWISKGLLLAGLTAAVTVVTWAVLRRPAAAQAAPPPAAPAPAEPLVAPGDHTGTPLFPALDEKRKRWGYIDAGGRFLLAPQYAGAFPFSEGLAFAWTADDGRLVCIDAQNRERFTLTNPLPHGWIVPEGGFRGGRARVVVQGTGSGNRSTYVDTRGALLGPPRFARAHAFADGLAAVEVDGKWGFLAPDGSFALKPAWAEVFDFSDGLAAVVVKKRMGYIDRAGKLVIPARYPLALPFAEGLAPVQPGSAEAGDTTEMGYIDRAGKLVLAPRYGHALPFSEGRARVHTGPGDRLGFIDKSGKLVVPAVYLQASDFKGGRAAVRSDVLWGYVDPGGALVIPAVYEVAGDFEHGLARVRRRGDDHVLREGYIDTAGTWIHGWRVDELGHGEPAPVADP